MIKTGRGCEILQIFHFSILDIKLLCRIPQIWNTIPFGEKLTQTTTIKKLNLADMAFKEGNVSTPAR